MGSRGYVVQHLRSAISKLSDEGPGRWKVTDCPCIDWVSLSYDVEGSSRGPAFSEEAPWRSWGGDALLKSAGVREYKVMTAVLSSGYSTWAKIEFSGTGDCRGAVRGARPSMPQTAFAR